MKRLSKKIISLMITLAIVMSMVISMHVSAAVMPGSGAQTLTITGQVYGENAEETNQVLEVSNITLSGKMGETFKGTVKAVVAGLDFFTLRAEADAQHLVLEIPQALENSISVEYGTFVSNISSQVLSLLGQMGIDLNDMTGTMPGLSSPFAQMSEEEIQDMTAPYLQLFMESIQECTSVENGVDIELTNLGLTKNGDLYTWAPTAEQFTELCEKLAAIIKEDNRLVEVYRQQLEQMRPMYDMFSSFTDEMSSEDIEEAYNQIYAVLDNLPEILTQNAEAFGQALASIGLNVQVGIEDNVPVLAKINFEAEGNPCSIGFENANRSDGATACIYFAQGDQTAVARLETSENGDETTLNIGFFFGGGQIGEINVNVSKTETTRFGLPVFTVNANFAGAALELKTENLGTSDVLSVDLSGLENLTGDQSFTGFHIDFTATNEDKTEDIESESIDISNYSLEELGSLIQQIGTNLQNYYNSL